MPYANSEDQRSYAKDHYLSNKELYKKRARENTQRYIERNRVYVNSLKEKSGCTDCLVKFPHYQLDFDHLSGFEKYKDVSRLVNSGCSIKKLDEEIRKCQVVCANCHRKRTWERKEDNGSIL